MQCVRAFVLLLAERLAPAPQRHVDAVVRHDPAFVEAVLDRMLDGDVQRVPLEFRRLEGGDELECGVRERQRFGEGFAEGSDLILAGRPGQSADPHRDRVYGAAADQLHDLVSGVLEA